MKVTLNMNGWNIVKRKQPKKDLLNSKACKWGILITIELIQTRDNVDCIEFDVLIKSRFTGILIKTTNDDED